MTRALTRIFVLLAMLLVFVRSSLADPPTDEERKKAEKLFVDVYGVDYEKASKLKESAPKVAFARKLAKSAEEIAKDDPVQAIILREKALPLAMSGASGHSLAVEMIEAMLPSAESRLAMLTQLVDLKDRLIRLEKSPAVAKVIDLVGLMRDLAVLQIAERDYSAAHKILERARTLAKSHLKPPTDLQTEIDGLLASTVQQEKIMLRMLAAEKILENKPEDSEANSIVGLAKLLLTDDRAAAAAFLAKSNNSAVAKIGAILSEEKISAAALADAVRAAVDPKLDKEFKSAMLGYALQNYRVAVEKEPNHPEMVRLKLMIGQLTDSVGESAPKISATPAKEPVVNETKKLIAKLTTTQWRHGTKFLYEFKKDGTFILVNMNRGGKYTISKDLKEITLHWLGESRTDEVIHVDPNSDQWKLVERPFVPAKQP